MKTTNKRNGKAGSKVINTATGTIYNTIREAAATTDIKYTTLLSYLNGNTTNKSPFEYLEPRENPKVWIKGSGGVKQQVINKNNGIIYDSINEAAKAEGLNKTTLGYYLRGEISNPTSLEVYCCKTKTVYSTAKAMSPEQLVLIEDMQERMGFDELRVVGDNNVIGNNNNGLEEKEYPSWNLALGYVLVVALFITLLAIFSH